MWRLRPTPSGHGIIDLDHSASEALPTDFEAETWSTKRRRKETPRPSSSSAGQPLTALDKQRQESVATALQLYSNPGEAGIKLLLPSAMDLTDNPFTHCPTEQLATSCLHSQWAPFAIFGRLLDGLPSMQDSRHSSPSIDQPSDYKSIFFGAYSQGPLVGLRAQTRRYPMVSRLLNAVLYTLSGEHNHSTVFLSRNRAMGLHSDSQNHQERAERFDPPVGLLRWPALCGIGRGRCMFRSPGQNPGIYLSCHSPFFVFRCTEEALDSSLVRLQTDPRVFPYSWRRSAPAGNTQCTTFPRLLGPAGWTGELTGTGASQSSGMSRSLLR